MNDPKQSLREQLEKCKKAMARENGSHDMEEIEGHRKNDWTAKVKRIVMPVDGAD